MTNSQQAFFNACDLLRVSIREADTAPNEARRETAHNHLDLAWRTFDFWLGKMQEERKQQRGGML